MWNFFLRVLTKTYNGVFILSGVALLILAIVFYLLLGREATNALVEQTLHREQLAARAGASSIESFFNLFGKSLTELATRVEIGNFSQDATTSLENYVGRWEGSPIGGVILIDQAGMVTANGNRDRREEVGTDLSDRKYFSWAKTAEKGEIFISDPIISRLGASKGKYIVTVSTPVVTEDGFKGLLAASVILGELTDQYIDNLRISDATRIYLIDKNGVIISSPIEKFVGVNYLDYILKTNIPGNKKIVEILKSSLELSDEKKIDIALPDEQKDGTLTRFLIAHSAVDMASEHWLLVVATPVNDALVFLAPFYFRNIGIAGLVFFAFLLISIRIAKIGGYKEGVEQEHNVHTKHKLHQEP